MNWADLTDIEPSNENSKIFSIQKQDSLQFNKLYKDTNKISYSKIVKKELNIPELQEVMDTSSKQSKPKETKKKGRSNYCYTCKPRGKVQKHIIERSELKQIVFHFDLHKRPLILVTPIKHYNTINEIPGPEIVSLFEGIRVFCDEWNIKDYQVSFNNGEWQTHSHFHIKIKTNEKIVNRLRRDHFLRLKLQKNYLDYKQVSA
jgi:hypothetical protein